MDSSQCPLLFKHINPLHMYCDNIITSLEAAAQDWILRERELLQPNVAANLVLFETTIHININLFRNTSIVVPNLTIFKSITMFYEIDTFLQYISHI
jgi:hypothetical protein